MAKELTKLQKIKEKMFEEGFIQIEQWLEKKGWSVECDHSVRDEIFFHGKYITISKRNGVEKRLYSLLHECGHLLIQQNNIQYEQQYPTQARMNQFYAHRGIEKSKDYRVETLTEEIAAWERGKKLANRLGLFYDQKNFQTLANKCIYTYIEWAAQP
jgi:hypothetical protein